MARVFIYSTLTCDQRYTSYSPSPEPGGIHTIEKQILIKGGANVADKQFVTHLGAMTEVTEPDYEDLEKNPVFQKHCRLKHITVRKQKSNLDSVIADMKSKDDSAPVSPKDFPERPEFQMLPKDQRPTPAAPKSKDT